MRPSSIGRSCATDLGRSECRTLRQVSIAVRKSRRYLPLESFAAEAMLSSSKRSVASSGALPVTAR